MKKALTELYILLMIGFSALGLGWILEAMFKKPMPNGFFFCWGIVVGVISRILMKKMDEYE